MINHSKRFGSQPAPSANGAPSSKPKCELFLQQLTLPTPRLRADFERLDFDERHLTLNSLVRSLQVQLQLSSNDLRASLGLHGTTCYCGCPGTGKTTAAFGVPNYVVEKNNLRAVLLEVNTHAIPGGERGACQRNTVRLSDHISEAAAVHPFVFVVINEIETLASSRQDLSAATNPLDTAFAVNAFLESLDKLATHKGVFILATTNLPDKIDSAVLDRFDDVFEFPKPGASQRLRILSKAIQAIQPSNRVAAMLRHAAASARKRANADERCREALIECSRLINATRDLSPRRLSQLPARSLGLRSESINSPLTLQHLVEAAKATRRLK